MRYRYSHFTREVMLRDMDFQGGPEPGEKMPDFQLQTTDGGCIRKDDYVGHRPLLLTFGSVTDPMTATASPVLKRLYEEFGDQIAFVTLYVREAHPSEGFPQPASMKQKLKHARVYKARDEIPWTVAADDVAGHLHRKLGAGSNAAYLMGIDGNILFRSLWSSDEQALREALKAALEEPSATIGESRHMVVPLLTGAAQTYETLTFAGCRAKEDFREEMPAVYGLARIASLFGPLPPLARGIAAVTIGVLAFGGAVGGLSWLMLRSRRMRGEQPPPVAEGPH